VGTVEKDLKGQNEGQGSYSSFEFIRTRKHMWEPLGPFTAWMRFVYARLKAVTGFCKIAERHTRRAGYRVIKKAPNGCLTVLLSCIRDKARSGVLPTTSVVLVKIFRRKRHLRDV
jgi:hypothetical protein